MGLMVEGEWTTQWYEPDEEGRFQREETVFHDWVRADGSTPFEPEADRYHLYVAWACPWAHRTLIARKLRGLEDVVSISVVHPFMGEDGWEFSDEEPGCIPDHVNGADYLREVYKKADDEYTGRVTVPVLWDKKEETIVNNESKEIMRMFDVEFEELAGNQLDLSPEAYRERIDEVIEEIYQPINNGVYRSGFAETQKAYDEAVSRLFDALDRWESVLDEQRYLCGPAFTEADICMFTTLFRFDLVYSTHFKCNIRQLREYPNLWNYTKEIFQMPGIEETLNIEHTKRHYYRSHESVNPRRIIPRGPDIDFNEPHDRGRLA